MASYHLSVKTIKRSAGRSATAAAAYRAGAAIPCEREGRLHDYTAKRGVQETFIVLPDDAPEWAGDRAQLWNQAEARETRKNSVTAREWELALPAEIGDGARTALARGFAERLAARYGVAADVAIHAPHREGDQRNYHAHILTTTRRLEPDGLTAKTRVLDTARTGGPEIETMREVWAELQNEALERAGEPGRVDHRTLEAQRDAAEAEGDEIAAAELDRPAEVKLGPAVNAMERRAARAAEAKGREYEPVTDRGRAVHAVRQLRQAFAEVRARVVQARYAYTEAREAGLDRIGAGLAALRVAVRGQEQDGWGGDAPDGHDRLRDQLARITERERWEETRERWQEAKGAERDHRIGERLNDILGRDDRQRSGAERDREAGKTRDRNRNRGRDRDDDYGL